MAIGGRAIERVGQAQNNPGALLAVVGDRLLPRHVNRAGAGRVSSGATNHDEHWTNTQLECTVQTDFKPAKMQIPEEIRYILRISTSSQALTGPIERTASA